MGHWGKTATGLDYFSASMHVITAKTKKWSTAKSSASWLIHQLLVDQELSAGILNNWMPQQATAEENKQKAPLQKQTCT